MNDRAILKAAVQDLTARNPKLSLEHSYDEQRVIDVLKLLIVNRIDVSHADVLDMFKEFGWPDSVPGEIESLFERLAYFHRNSPTHFSQQDLETWKLASIK